MMSANVTSGIILLLYGLLVALLPREIHSAFNDATFEEVPLQGASLELYETGYKGYSTAKCAAVCSMRRGSSPGCQAFRFDPQDNTCQFYQYSTTTVASSSLQIFQYKILGVFHNVAVGESQLSIYASPIKRYRPGARVWCSDVGGYLMEFKSLDDYEAIERVVAGSSLGAHFHVGYNDEAIEGTWVSDRDGSPVNTALLLWRNGGPDNYAAGEHCAVYSIVAARPLRPVGDVYCQTYCRFLCKRDV